jgi:hypothetical protein
MRRSKEDVFEDGHKQDVAVIRDPGTAEVSVTEPVESLVRIVIARASVPAHQTSIGAKLDHPERHGGAGICVPVSTCTYEWVDITSQVTLSMTGGCQYEHKAK